MFVVHEIEKILQSVLEGASGRQEDQHKFRTTLSFIERVQVDQLRIFDQVPFEDIEIKDELGDYYATSHQLDLKSYIASQSYLTTDLLFASTIKTILLDRLAQLPERPYPAARLLICSDHESYQSLLKFQYFTQKLNHLADEGHNNHKFLLHKRPFGLSAIVLMSDLFELLDQVNRPIAMVKLDGTANFDYTIIKQIFPYLKITDLVIVMNRIGNLRLHTFTLDGTRAHQVTQFLTHFARSSLLVELHPIQTRFGQQHPIYDNVAIFKPLDLDTPPPAQKVVLESGKASEQVSQQQQQPPRANPHLKLTLLQLASMAQRVQQLLSQLEWQLESITFRSADHDGFSKIFSQILESVVKAGSSSSSRASTTGLADTRGNLSLVPVRVLVLDRSFDLHGLLRHPDRYGPFLEQERQQQATTSVRLDQVDPLDRVLHPEKLTDVLKTILRYSTNPTLVQAPPPNGATKTPVTVSSSAIRRHLDAVKSIYSSMNEGYLLLLKLESSLANVADRLRRATATIQTNTNSDDKCEPLTGREETELAERLKRSALVLRQLLGLAANSISPRDSLRVALIWLDTVNLYLHLLENSQATPSGGGAKSAASQLCKTLLEAKSALIASKEFRTTTLDDSNNAISSTPTTKQANNNATDLDKDSTQGSGGARANNNGACLSSLMSSFDTISRERCANRSRATLEQMVEAFYTRKLRNQDGYSTLKLPPTGANGLIKNVSRNKIVVLVLGSISYDELTRIKLLESELMKRRKFVPAQQQTTGGGGGSGDILTIASGLLKPSEFVDSLLSPTN